MTFANQLVRSLGLLALIAGAAMPALSGCNGFPAPPIPVDIVIVPSGQIVAADQNDGMVDVPLSVFCDLFNEQRLNDLLVSFGGPQLEGLISVDRVELETITVAATSGTFNEFTEASMDLTIVDVGQETIELGAAMNTGGLGTEFDLVQDMPVDLLNDLEDDTCGIATLRLDGAAAPAQDIGFQVVARVIVYTTINF